MSDVALASDLSIWPRRRMPLKRAFDFVLACVLLVLLGPVFLIAAVAVKLDSKGPVFFRQQRVGRGFQPFWIYKFRTMVADAPARGAAITAGADPRITRVGRFLRQTKIDEFPQFWNVLVGDMSFVGPRPEVPRYVEMFAADYRKILTVRPGITDPASLKFRDEAEILGRSADPEAEYVNRILPEKIALAHQYIDECSLLYDITLLLRTALRIVR